MLYDPLGELISKKPLVRSVRCCVPICKSVTKVNPNKVFFFVPFEEKARLKWMMKLKIDLFPFRFRERLTSPKNMFACEDHFKDEKDKLPKPFECFHPANPEGIGILQKYITEESQVNSSSNDEIFSVPVKEEDAETNETDNGLFTCEFCYENFPDNSVLQLHIQENHLDIKPELFQCNKCSSSFENEADVLMHLDTAHKDHKPEHPSRETVELNYTNIPYSLLYIINEENLPAFKPKIYQCYYCPMSYLYLEDLERHQIKHKTHNNIKKLIPTNSALIIEKNLNNRSNFIHGNELKKNVTLQPLKQNLVLTVPKNKKPMNTINNRPCIIIKKNLPHTVTESSIEHSNSHSGRKKHNESEYLVNNNQSQNNLELKHMDMEQSSIFKKPDEDGKLYKRTVQIFEDSSRNKKWRVIKNYYQKPSQYQPNNSDRIGCNSVHKTKDNEMKKSEVQEWGIKVFDDSYKQNLNKNKEQSNNSNTNYLQAFKNFVKREARQDTPKIKTNKLNNDEAKFNSIPDSIEQVLDDDSEDTLSAGSIEIIKCDFCHLEFIEESYLARHIEVKHNIQTSCKKCSITFTTKNDIITHNENCTRRTYALFKKVEVPKTQIKPKERVKVSKTRVKPKDQVKVTKKRKKVYRKKNKRKNFSKTCVHTSESSDVKECSYCQKIENRKSSRLVGKCDICNQNFYDKIAFALHNIKMHKKNGRSRRTIDENKELEA